jgi:hypothetical protein
MIGPPKKRGGSVNAALNKLTSTRILSPRAATIKAIWQREAVRLFREYWRSGNPKHLVAFVVHITAMRSHATGYTQ